MQPATTRASRTRELVAIGLVSLAGLLLEVAYTRIVSYKLWYYYTYLVIGLALLGIGSGGIAVAVFRRLRDTTTERIIAVCSLVGAASVAVGYLIIARIPIDTVAIWDYGTGHSFKNIGVLGLICFLLFATFVAIGIVVSTLLGRAHERLGSYYAADLAGAAIGCLLAIPLISSFGPPRLVFIAAALLAAVGVATAPRAYVAVAGVNAAIAVVLLVCAAASSIVPDVTPNKDKLAADHASYSAWGPVFRVDVLELPQPPDGALLVHDGTFGSSIWQYDGNPQGKFTTRYDHEQRALPFHVLQQVPKHELIIGSAGGNEILASLHFKAPNIEAVELNPVTVSILRKQFYDYTGHIATDPHVHLHQGDGRTYLARSNEKYDLVWYVAPDSYAANNAVSSGAFVLSESYLYTSEMIRETLHHLSDRGVMTVQFGHLDFANSPNRAARYIVTAQDALRAIGVKDPSQHILLAADTGGYATIMVKRTVFTAEEVQRFGAMIPTLTDPPVREYYAPGKPPVDNVAAKLAAASTPTALNDIVHSYARDITAVHDDKPFFWHFTSFGDALQDIFHRVDAREPELAIGERVLLLLLFIAILYAALFLLVPFFVVRKQWKALPHKGISALYFAALGLGFMLFEITMIQRLSRFLGYPTYSLTVTLASLLVATGIGSLLSSRLTANRNRAAIGAVVVLLALTIFYELALDNITDSLQSSGLAVRVLFALVVLLPLGVCLGLFMPLGLGVVSSFSGEQSQAYVAWAWAVNGFLSVIGSVLTTILSMSYGFARVQGGAVVVYALAVVALHAMSRRAAATPAVVEPIPALTPA